MQLYHWDPIMSEALPSLAELRALIGSRLSLRGEIFTVVEILDHPLAIVAQADDLDSTIQADLHGHARRRTKDTMLIPVIGGDGHALHDEFLEMRRL
jgi:hypothetical protein